MNIRINSILFSKNHANHSRLLQRVFRRMAFTFPRESLWLVTRNGISETEFPNFPDRENTSEWPDWNWTKWALWYKIFTFFSQILPRLKNVETVRSICWWKCFTYIFDIFSIFIANNFLVNLQISHSYCKCSFQRYFAINLMNIANNGV